jgi:hypothetical protein
MSGRNGNLLAEVERDALDGNARAAHRGLVVGLARVGVSQAGFDGDL